MKVVRFAPHAHDHDEDDISDTDTWGSDVGATEDSDDSARSDADSEGSSNDFPVKRKLQFDPNTEYIPEKRTRGTTSCDDRDSTNLDFKD